MSKDEYSLKAGCHTYITLLRNGTFVRCYDNDIMEADDIIKAIEKYTGSKITKLKLQNDISAFNGFHFLGRGFRNFITQEVNNG